MRCRLMRTLAPVALLLALLPAGAAGGDGTVPPSPPARYGAGFGMENFTYGKGNDEVEVDRRLLYGEVEIPRLSLLGDDRFFLQAGVQDYELEELDRTDPALMLGVAWRGTLAPALGEGWGPFGRWRVEGRMSARFHDAPEGPAGTAIDLAGEVLLCSPAGGGPSPSAGFYLGPSLRYGILPLDHRTVGDNGAVTTSTSTSTTEGLFRMAGIVAGAEIPVGRRFLLRPEARLGADYSASLSLVYLAPSPAPAKDSPPAPAAPAAAPPPTRGGTEEGGAAAPPGRTPEGGAPR